MRIPTGLRFFIGGTAAVMLVGALAAPAFALTLPVSEDVASKAGSVTAALGKAATLAVSKGRQAFLRFGVAQLASFAPPTDVQSARLVIFIASVKTAGELDVQFVHDDWSESPGATVPAPGLGDDNPTTIPATGIIAKRFIVVDVTSKAKAWLAGTIPDFGFAITSKDGIADVSLGAKEGFTKGYPAALEIEVNGGGGDGIWSLNGANAYYNGGNVGLGTTTPANPLTLLAFGHGFEQTSGTVRLGTFVSGSGGWLGTISNDNLYFFVNDGGPSMTVDTNGNVGIGQTAPDVKLNVEGDARLGGRLNVNSDGYSDVTMTLRQRTFGDDFVVRAQDASGADMLTLSHAVGGNNLSMYGDAVKSSGGTSWGTLSDGRLKRDVRRFEPGLREVLKLRPVRFHYRDGIEPGLNSTQEQVGFIAQDVREVIPDAVTVREDGYLVLKADPIHWATINAIRELDAKLEARANALPGTNDACSESGTALDRFAGNVTTDANGDATVTVQGSPTLQQEDVRYQLTVLGQFAQAIVSRELAGGRFGIKTDKPYVKVSWQITGAPQDAGRQGGHEPS